jgi:NAD(P)-dependent dehydrogenase (short-subunit alcohol dehydrogenase family)
MMNWTLSDVPKDLTGKIFVITGTSSGIGTVIAYELARRGAKVVAANRNTHKAEQAMAAVRSASDDLSGFSIEELDVSSLSSVRAFAKQIQSDPTVPHIDGLILNAGIMALPERRISVDGFEMQMATNVLGHHLLTSLLLEKLKAAPSAVVVSTSSSASSSVNRRAIWDDINAEQNYEAWEVYGLSKIAAYQFRDELRERLLQTAPSSKIKVLTTHPGLTATPLFDASQGALATIFRSVKGVFMMEPAEGALSTLRAVVDESIPDGSFLGPGGWTGFRGPPKVIKDYNQKMAQDPELRAKMWAYCDTATEAIWT